LSIEAFDITLNKFTLKVEKRLLSLWPLCFQRRSVSSMFLWTCIGLTTLSHAQGRLELAKAKHCLSCHAVDQKVVGPSYFDIAIKYQKDPLAKDRLAQKIIKGGSGVWGVIPMPANPQVSPEESQALAAWILQLKAL
jgi:cytochrome c